MTGSNKIRSKNIIFTPGYIVSQLTKMALGLPSLLGVMYLKIHVVNN